jgi:hypothetical protein
VTSCWPCGASRRVVLDSSLTSFYSRWVVQVIVGVADLSSNHSCGASRVVKVITVAHWCCDTSWSWATSLRLAARCVSSSRVDHKVDFRRDHRRVHRYRDGMLVQMPSARWCRQGDDRSFLHRLAMRIQESKTNPVPSWSATERLNDALKFTSGSPMNTPTWSASYRCFTTKPIEGYPQGDEL